MTLGPLGRAMALAIVMRVLEVDVMRCAPECCSIEINEDYLIWALLFFPVVAIPNYRNRVDTGTKEWVLFSA